MLLERNNPVAVDWPDEASARRDGEFAKNGIASRGTVPAPYIASGGRYGEDRHLSASSLAMTVLVHMGVFAALLGLGATVVTKEREHLTVVDLSPPPPPPPAPAPPQPQKMAVTVPPPLLRIDTPRPRPVVPVSLDIPPVPVTDPQPVSVPAPPAPPAAPAPPSIVTASNLGTRMISGSPPGYPLESRRRKEQGTVELLVILGLDGRVEAISVSRSSGHSRLDSAALNAVRRWRWSPTTRDGSPVKVRGVVEIPFVLQGVE
ncbi:MAG: energy transducer TonB [Novosphingobium sp.]|nr:energy transducer TonB [Novosphingobium sp.]